MATSSSSSSSSTVPILSQQSQVATSNDDKIRACQRLGELFDLSVNATEQACFDAAWEKCKTRDWTLLKRCQEDLNHIVNEQGRSLLQQAIRIGEIALATEMIANGIAVHARDTMGNTSMHYAVQTESLHLVLKLYEHISQDARNDQGQTPLHYAAARGQLDVIRALIAQGANLGSTTQAPIHDLNVNASLSIGDLTLPNLTPLGFAAIRGDRDCVDLFLSENKKNPELNLSLKFGTMGNLVHLLIAFHHSHLLEFVLKKYPDEVSLLLNERNTRGLTPFMLAAYLGNERALVSLKNAPVEEMYKVNLEATDPHGRTAVHHAVLGRQKKSLSFLHSFGVNLMQLDNGGKIPLNLAEGSEHEKQSVHGHLYNLCKQKTKTQNALPNFIIDPPENLVFKGNDPTGLAYLGVIKALGAKGKINGIKRAVGPSTGALIATLFALGYSSDEIASKAKVLSNFFDCPLADRSISAIPKDSPEYATVARLRDIMQKHSPLGKDQFKTLHQLPSLCTGVSLLNWLKECIDEKTGISDCTFGELRELVRTNPQFKHLTVFTTCFGNTLTLSKFSSEDSFSEDIVISHAVCAALSIPGIFPLKSLYSKNKAGGVDESLSLGLHGDAAPINNFPIEAYDREKYQSVMPLGEEAGEYFRLNKRTLGFALEAGARNHSILETATVQQFLEKVLELYCQMDASIQQSHLYNRFRVIKIEYPIGGLSSKSNEEKREAMINVGLSTTVDFFDKQERLAVSESSFRFLHLRTNQGSRWTNLKSPFPYFRGRTSQIGFLKQRLIDETEISSSSAPSSSTSIPKRRIPCVVLTGAEGMGKSEMAIQFAHQYRERFSVIWWIEAATPQSIERSYKELAEALHLSIDRTHSFEYVIREVNHFLETEPLGNPYLLIFDNAEEVIDLPQSSNGRFIITTTESRHFLDRDILPIGVFDKEEAIEVLQLILGEEINGQMRQLVDEVGCLPVILSQAAQYIRSTKMTLDEYLELLTKEKLTVIEMLRPDARYSKTQISAWRITHKRLGEREPLVYEWLEMCAYLQPDAIPFSYLEMWLQLFKSQLSHAERVMMRSMILETLDHLGIIRFDERRETYSLHRIRQEMIKALHEPAKSQFLKRQVMCIVAAFGRSLKLKEDGQWLTFAPHESQIRFILETVDADSALEEADQPVENTRSTNIALTGSSSSLALQTAHSQIIEVNTGYEDRAYVHYLLGRWCTIQGKLREAEGLFMRSLKIWGANFSGDHADIASILLALGGVFVTERRLQIGEWYVLKSYHMRRRIYKGDHIEIADSLQCLAACCFPLTDLKKCQHYLNDALVMLRRLYSEGNYRIALVLANKGIYYRFAHRLDKAYAKTLEAWQLLKRLYPTGDYYPIITANESIMAFVLRILGDILVQQRKYQEAKIPTLESLKIARKMKSSDIYLVDQLYLLGLIEYRLDHPIQSRRYFIEFLDCNRRSTHQRFDHPYWILIVKQAFKILSYNSQTNKSAIKYFRDLGNILKAEGRDVEATLYFAEADRIASSNCVIL